MLNIVSGEFCAQYSATLVGNSERRQLAVALGPALSSLDVDRSVRGILCEEIRDFLNFKSGSELRVAEEAERPVLHVLPTALLCSITETA